MPPSNWHEPRRAKSSTSDYSITEFLRDFPRTYVNPAAFVLTDGWMAYKPLRHEFLDHRVINHSAGSYVDGDIHTNTIEGFFGNLKTGMRGAYKHVSDRWLQSYLDEYAWRYNERFRGQRAMFHRLLDQAAK